MEYQQLFQRGERQGRPGAVIRLERQGVGRNVLDCGIGRQPCYWAPQDTLQVIADIPFCRIEIAEMDQSNIACKIS